MHGKADIGVADTAACDFDDDLFRRGFERGKLPALQRLSNRDQAISVGSVNRYDSPPRSSYALT
jgi:hypothetical protein